MCKNIPPFSVSYPHQQHCPEHPQGVFISFFDIFISYILFSDGGENACVFKILAYFKDTEVVKINLEPTTTVCLITSSPL